ncbi:MAG: Gldg family protein [Clostridia bacterium]|nr:Gldg family protein [Clostridia bacterium]
MNNTQNGKKSVLRDKRVFKYGSLSVVLTAVFIALIIALNLLFSSLSLSGDLTVDLTPEDFTSIGDESMRLLSALGKDLDITITFMSARDMFDLDDYNYNGINLTGIIRDLAENYARTFDGSGELGTVRVEYKELDSDPEFEAKILEESATQLNAGSIIVKGKHHYRVLNIQAFFEVTESGSYYAFNGEYRFTTAMLQSSISQPQKVLFTIGHGELLPSELRLPSLFAGAGFAVDTVNLAQDEIDPDAAIIICYDPQTDFSFAEIDKLTNYLSGYQSFMVFVDSATPELTNLQAMLNDGWGINYKPQYRVTDSTHSLDGKPENINAKYPEVDSDSADRLASYQIYKTVSDMGGYITTAVPEAVELYIKPGLTQDNFSVETVLTTYDTAVSAKAGAQGTKGEMPLALLSTRSGYGDNNVSRFAYVMLIGSTQFAGDSNLASATRGNRRVLLAAARIFAADRVSPDIKSKQFADAALDIETGTATTLTWLICTVVPGIVLILGIVMFFRRRHL